MTGNLERSKRKIALLGTGYIAEWHAKALASIPDLNLVAACDRLIPRAKAFAEKFNVPRIYESSEEMLAAEQLDSVHVLVPPDRHFEACSTVLSAGVDAFLEKPMCGRFEDCQALERLAQATNRRLGIGHNFLFSECYELLRRDVHSGVIGRLDHVSITWHRELGQLADGPFDLWMLRDPRNIIIEVGPHCVAPLLDLLGSPRDFSTRVSNPIELPNGLTFFQRWQASAFAGRTAIELRFSFAPGFDEFTIHVRGSLASAIVDLDRNTYCLLRNNPLSDDFNRYAIVNAQARSMQRQARRAIGNYILSKLHLRARGNSYGASIARAMEAFYDNSSSLIDARICAATGAETVRICEEIGQAARIEACPFRPRAEKASAEAAVSPRILVLGATGFIGQELVRQLVEMDRPVRLLVRNPSKIPLDLLSSNVDVRRGDLASDEDLRRAMAEIDLVFHLARPNVKSWTDYQSYEINVTRRIAEQALAAGIKRLIYTGTIDSYYAGARAGTINEQTPLDPGIERRNLYARAKAASEQLLERMHREQGLPIVIVRPGIVIGRGSSPFHWGIGMWWYKSVCQTWGEGRNKLPLVLVHDVAKGLIAASEISGIEGDSFNLVSDPSLTAQDYLDELDRCGGFRIQRRPTAIWKFYLADLFKWSVKVAVRHPDRRLPSYRDWESRRQCATFDCSRAKNRLNWQPVSGREDMVRTGIEEPLREAMR